jgi:hypothetical protein
MSRTFRPKIKVILGVDLSAAIFANLSTAPHVHMCWRMGTFGGFSVSCIGSMATN